MNDIRRYLDILAEACKTPGAAIREDRERYQGVVEPGSRSRFGQIITIEKPLRVYHATHEGVGKVLTNRDVKTYDSMGTWLTSNRDMASTMYGPHVEAYRLPPGRYLMARRNQDMWELILNCLPLIEKHIGTAEVEHLKRFPLTGTNIEFLQNLNKMALEKIAELGDNAASTSTDGMIHELLRWKQPETLKRYNDLNASYEIYRKVCKNANYCRDYRALLTEAGINGIIWNGRNWDNSPDKQTIFLVFHQEDLSPMHDNLP